MSSIRDYVEWHRGYDDPNSDLSWRLRTVQSWLHEALDERSGALRIGSACAGDGRDVIDVLASRADAGRFSATLIELNPELARRARTRAAAAGLAQVSVREGDAGIPGTYVGAVPADRAARRSFGNISLADIERTVRMSPRLCAPGATLLWSRGRERGDHNDEIRSRFAEAGFSELRYATLESQHKPALGAFRYEGEARQLAHGEQLFSYLLSFRSRRSMVSRPARSIRR